MTTMIDCNKLSFAEFLLISNAIIYGDVRKLQCDDFAYLDEDADECEMYEEVEWDDGY